MSYLRTALVTGGSSGIGFHVCRELIRQGVSVFLHAPAPAAAHAAAGRLIADGGDPALIHPVAADFRRLSDVFSLARYLRHQHEGLDLLINNAGALATPGVTHDGIDATFQINYVAPYALTRLLAPALNITAGRVVTLTSALHRDACLDPRHPGVGPLQPAGAYAQAHLALMLFTRTLARASQHQVSAVAVHPGYVDTGSFEAVYGPGGLPVADGAAAVLHAVDPVTDVIDGGYYEGLLASQPAAQARDDQAGAQLWLATARLIGWDYTAARRPATGTGVSEAAVPVGRS